MLQRLHLQNFTVFADATFEFSPGLNVLVGTNGTGKSHVLKVGYAMWEGVPEIDVGNDRVVVPLFLPDIANDLIRRGTNGPATAEGWRSEHGGKSVRINIPAALITKIIVSSTALHSHPVFIPPKEVLSFYYGFIALYEKREVDYDLTYLELCKDLSLPLLREVKDSVADALVHLQSAMGGTVKIEGNRFVFVPTDSTQTLPINLYAEGLRKFGILWQLLRNGSFSPSAPLFWDEPEANLNPALLKQLAAVLAALARQGFQIILATHSLFLLKELHILSRAKAEKELPIRYFGLSPGPDGDTQVDVADELPMLPTIAALDAEVQQSGEYLTLTNSDDEYAD